MQTFSLAENNSLEFLSSGALTIHWENGATTCLTAPAFFWIRCGTKFRFSLATEISADHIYADVMGPRSERMMDALDELYPDRCFYPRNSSFMHQLFTRLLRLYRDSPVENQREMCVIAEQMVCLAEEAATEHSADKDRYHLKKLAEEMRMEPFREWDFTQEVRQRELSFAHFRRLFQQEFGVTPRGYILQQRMIRAAELLCNTNMRVKEIEEICGFRSAIEFSRTFRKYYGLSPMNYRNQKKK